MVVPTRYTLLVSLLLIGFIFPGTVICKDCKTEKGENGGDQVNRACVFPFRYKGIVYNKCTHADQAKPWCSTEVDSQGSYISGKWGICGSDCPVRTKICEPGHFSCSNGRCVLLSDKCNGKNECGDGIDEEICGVYERLDNYFCNNGLMLFNTLQEAKRECTRRTDCPMLFDVDGKGTQFTICGQPPEKRPSNSSSILYVKKNCKTIGGPSSNSSCIFPFIYGDKTYSACPHDELDGYWCSTKVDSQGKHTGGQGSWGICAPQCPKSACTVTSCCGTSTNWHIEWKTLIPDQQKAWLKLGWDGISWKNNIFNKSSQGFCWTELSKAQSVAALTLCYNEQKWNGEMKENFNLACGDTSRSTRINSSLYYLALAIGLCCFMIF